MVCLTHVGHAGVVGHRASVGDGFPAEGLTSATTASAAADEPPEPSTEPPRSLTTTFAPRRAAPGGMLPAEAAACARDDRHLTVKPDVRHLKAPCPS
jgi:hypothetical protein